jgi:hypothetical protein
MKLVIASDIHGFASAARALSSFVDEFNPDNVLLLGDLLYHGPRNDFDDTYNPKEVIGILNNMKDKIIAVRGNCDAEVDQVVLEFPISETYMQFTDGDARMFLTHGHIYGPNKMPQFSGTKRALLSGHTHIKTLDWREGVLCVNPGSTSIPRDGVASFATYEDGVFTLRKLTNGHEIESAELF